MYFRPLLTSYFFLFLAFQSNGQNSSYKVANTPFLRTLRNPRFDGCELVTYSSLSLKIIDFKTSNFRNYGQILLIRKGELFIYISATGMLYKCSGTLQADSLRFDRIDNTEHFGYNINTKAFVHKDRFYNIGGYGFWRWNGQLRFFDEQTKDWKIERLNREIPIVLGPPGFPQWKSVSGNQLISLGYVLGRQSEKVPDNQRVMSIDSVISLDLEKGDWKVLGKLNPLLEELSKIDNILLAVLDSGIVVQIKENLQYLNLLGNKIYSLDNQNIWNFFTYKMTEKVCWQKDGILYYTTLGKWGVDSLQISHQDFIDTGEEVYATSSNINAAFVASIAVLVLLGGFGMYWKKRKSVVLPDIKEVKPIQDGILSPYPVKEVFDEIEKALLNRLIEDFTMRNSRTAIDDINRVLGVASKSGDMQKRKRSDVIRSINSKYRISYPDRTVQLIDRVKSNLDARLYEYFITESEIALVQPHLL